METADAPRSPLHQLCASDVDEVLGNSCVADDAVAVIADETVAGVADDVVDTLELANDPMIGGGESSSLLAVGAPCVGLRHELEDANVPLADEQFLTPLTTITHSTEARKDNDDEQNTGRLSLFEDPTSCKIVPPVLIKPESYVEVTVVTSDEPIVKPKRGKAAKANKKTRFSINDNRATRFHVCFTQLAKEKKYGRFEITGDVDYPTATMCRTTVVEMKMDKRRHDDDAKMLCNVKRKLHVVTMSDLLDSNEARFLDVLVADDTTQHKRARLSLPGDYEASSDTASVHLIDTGVTLEQCPRHSLRHIPKKLAELTIWAMRVEFECDIEMAVGDEILLRPLGDTIGTDGVWRCALTLP